MDPSHPVETIADKPRKEKRAILPFADFSESRQFEQGGNLSAHRRNHDETHREDERKQEGVLGECGPPASCALCLIGTHRSS